MNIGQLSELSTLKKLYYEMLRIRRVEETVSELYKEGHIKAPVHLSIGQEAVAVGVMSALEKSDKIVSTHRCHGHYLAKGGDMSKMFAELLGKSDGCCCGKGGTMHLFDDEAGHVISAPLVGASIAFAVGLGLAFKIKNEKKVSVAFFGDGAIEEGIFWESLNFASVHHLPVLFVCENNLYATHSPILKRQPAAEIVSRVGSHGVKTFRVANGNDVLAVSDTAHQAIKLVRNGQPCFMEAVTYRWREHWGVGEDWHLGYRTLEEGKYWIDNCPLKTLNRLLVDKAVSKNEISRLEEKVKQEIDQAVDFAFESKPPSANELLSDVSVSPSFVSKDNIKSDRKLGYKEAAAEGLLQAMELDDDVILMGEGVDNITGVYGHVLPAYQKFGSVRVIDTPLSENGLTGIAVGAALGGMRPIIIHQRNDFMLLAMDQMFNQAAKLRYASGGKHKISITILSFVARKPGEGVQHSQSLHSIFAHFPGVKVGMPTSPADAKGMILMAIFDEDPVIILEHRSLFDKVGPVPAGFYVTPYSANLESIGKDLTIVCLSAVIEQVKEGVDMVNNKYQISGQKICPDIIDLRWVRPYDSDLIINSVRKTGRLLVVDTGWKHFSVSSEIIAAVCEDSHSYLKKPPKRIAMTEAPCPASHFIEKYYHPETGGIVKNIMELCGE
ncbi:MAG: hypothetical protein A3B86_02655 [Candidatus Yanofskybacteria bacterium RIFCSPHIGHO2_02_FULL_38_22b]|uniref:Transketolase-like pyrimidine-binding domain-containing protein n=1 Tax=Candidatus Yanofskybacteria bacterium RIFCSPHIGHO2_02_FULL_38_22b TaxID=1802673 RepID=A0A1F8F668_9BACT|nr:MAG: hypothetical protein A2816_03200 [Candidatus Yanofskybacteria bacterium RIFCSPHIGHO2_01_FULL_39_44]OGN07756.1 MAG: hypothetical protein A3B86_02655 [Candidatus Yanofskybacteria bacterium RIFCSPHIGHO2_02_FULL_38_22b]OGN20638.1 MAG: hypothetical protein A2910_02490 [Candidatus Yanofskybacteria bacterium RIFCSPLOWO2_01_FULL_39_28]